MPITSKILNVLLAMTMLWAGLACANEQPGAAPSALTVAYQAAIAAAQQGPAQVALGNQATLALPAGYLFIPKAEAAKFLTEMGNRTGDKLLGMVVPTDPAANWMVIASFENSGYVRDDDAKEWNADELLQSLKEGTEAQNEYRREHGIPEFVVAGWVQAPAYDATAHRLVWSAKSRDKNPVPNADEGVNYNTYALGREGYVSLNLVTNLNSIEAEKPVAQALLGGLQFNAGKRYEEFNSNTDRIAEYGLAALIGGVAAKKLGLFAMVAAFAVKFAKIIGISIFAALAGLKKYLDARKA